MRDFLPIDAHLPVVSQTPIEEYPGFLGVFLDGDLYMIDELKFLQISKWHEYQNLIENSDDCIRILEVNINGVIVAISIEPSDNISFAIDGIPSVDVQLDTANGAYAFFLKDGHTLEEAIRSLNSFDRAIDDDIKKLQKI